MWKKASILICLWFFWIPFAQAQVVLSSPWVFGKREMQGITIPFLSWQGKEENIRASVRIYRAPPSVLKDGDGMAVTVQEGMFQCDGAPLTVAMMDGTLLEFPTEGACANGLLEVHSTLEQAKTIWQLLQKGFLPSGIRQNSHYLVVQSNDQQGLEEFQRENETSVRLVTDPKEREIFSSKWTFQYTKVKSGRFPSLSYEGISEENRIFIQIFRMPQSLSRQHGDILIVMVPQKGAFSCNGDKIRLTMTDGSFFDLSATGQCQQNMVQAHSWSDQEAEIWKKVQAGILPHAIGVGEKTYFKLLWEGDEGLKAFQQENQADG